MPKTKHCLTYKTKHHQQGHISETFKIRTNPPPPPLRRRLKQNKVDTKQKRRGVMQQKQKKKTFLGNSTEP